MEKKYSVQSEPLSEDYKMVYIMTDKGEVLMRGAVPNEYANDIINIFKKEKK